MGGRARTSAEDKSGVPFRIAWSPNPARPFTVRDAKYEPLLLDAAGRARTFATPEAAIEAARSVGVSYGTRADQKQKAGRLLGVDRDSSAFDRNVSEKRARGAALREQVASSDLARMLDKALKD
jgi:hypothetical protein